MVPQLSNEILDLLLSDESLEIVITTHHKPDGDAMGSSLGLSSILQKLGHSVRVVTPTDYAHFLHWLPGNDDVINFEESKEQAAFLAASADVIFCLDFNDLSRINDFANSVEESDAVVIMIDHHQNPKPFYTYEFHTTETSSTCELIYHFILQLGLDANIDTDIASCLYTGIMTDTGSFRYPSTYKSTHEAVSRLMDTGFNHSSIHERIFNSNRLEGLQLKGYVLSQKLEVIPEYNTALITLTAEELRKFNVQTGDTEGFVNYGLSISGIKFAALIIDRTKLVKMSFRSVGDFPCNEFSSNHFNGGGHKNAAGGASEDALEEVIAQFKSHLTLYKDQLK